jgi:hypothetical protein
MSVMNFKLHIFKQLLLTSIVAGVFLVVSMAQAASLSLGPVNTSVKTNVKDVKSGSAVLNWSVNAPNNEIYKINILENGKTKIALANDKAKAGTYSYNISLPYSASVEIDLLDATGTVADKRVVTVKSLATTSAAASNSNAALGLQQSQVLVSASPTSVTIKYGLTRAPKQGENVAIKVFGAKAYQGTTAGGVIGDPKPITTESGEITIALAGVTNGDKFTLQLVDPQANKQLGLPVSANVTAASATAGGTTPAGDQCKQSANTAFQFCDTLFAPGTNTGISANDYLQRFYYWAVGIAVFGAAGMMIYAGYRYATSRGNPSEISNAKEIIISSLVGLALLVLSFTILRFLGINVVNIR